jgi:TonB family protein
MPSKRWLLVSMSFAVLAALALSILLYITNNSREPTRPAPQPRTPVSATKVASPVPSEANPAPPPTAKFGVPVFAGNAGFDLVRIVRPQYTEAALNAHYEGKVKVNFVLRKDGRAHDIEIVNSPGFGMDRNIIEAVKDWQWIQYLKEEQNFSMTFVFKLDH